MDKELFGYDLPPDRIAYYPHRPRDYCKLLVIDREEGEIVADTKFYNIHKFLHKGDLLLLNNTKVLKSRVYMKKKSGGTIKVLIVKQTGKNRAECLIDGNRLRSHKKLFLDNGIYADVVGRNENNKYILEFNCNDVSYICRKFGVMPLPPYIRRKETRDDVKWYQNLYASVEGSIASPTAGLHFTNRLLKKLENKGVLVDELTLHISTDTFRPVTVNDIEKHQLEGEYYKIPDSVETELSVKRNQFRKVVACGTSVVRTLESWNKNQSKSGIANILITPGFRFSVVDMMITNFHQPYSFPILMTAAFAGEELLKKAYNYALKNDYRFLSYGDAMLIQ